MVMRGENPDGVSANTFKAAELLGKHLGLFKGEETPCGQDVVIVDDISKAESKS